ncbi:MAG: CBS domain-containing protein [Alphaproteobacteria bacterium]|nr:CBS domain-containing protein [Alphaproteobacteria bacterium]
MFGLSVRLFRVFGIDVRVDLSWALIAAFIAWSLAVGVFPKLYAGFSPGAYWWMAIVAIIGLALSIIIHELAHSLVAKAEGLPLKSVTLFFLGGVSELEDEPKSPLAEFAMAIAGPAISVVLAFVFSQIANLIARNEEISAASAAFHYLALINFMLAAFNMLPALPLDGGRAFRALMWRIRGDFAAATRISSRVGVWIATAIIAIGAAGMIFGAFVGGLWWVVIGLFIRSMAASAVYQEQMLRLFKGAAVSKFMTSDPVSVSPDISLRMFVDDYVYERHFDLFPVVKDGALVGAIGLKETKSAPVSEWETTTVGTVMSPVGESNTIDVSADAMEALAKMHKQQASRLIVVDDGRLVGVIALKDLLDLLALKMALEGR